MSPALRDGRPNGGDGVTQQKAVVEKYTDGFRRVDLAQIMSCFVRRRGVGAARRQDVGGQGRVRRGGRQRRRSQSGIDSGPVGGGGRHRRGSRARLRRWAAIRSPSSIPRCFTFTDGLVSRLDTFHIWLGEVPA